MKDDILASITKDVDDESIDVKIHTDALRYDKLYEPYITAFIQGAQGWVDELNKGVTIKLSVGECPVRSYKFDNREFKNTTERKQTPSLN